MHRKRCPKLTQLMVAFVVDISGEVAFEPKEDSVDVDSVPNGDSVVVDSVSNGDAVVVTSVSNGDAVVEVASVPSVLNVVSVDIVSVSRAISVEGTFVLSCNLVEVSSVDVSADVTSVSVNNILQWFTLS